MRQSILTLSRLIAKDLKIERRTRQIVGTMVIFALSIVVVFSFSLDVQVKQDHILLAGLFWISLTFASILGFYRLYASESQHGNLDALRLMPFDKALIFVAKVVSSFMFLTILQLIFMPLFAVFFNLELQANTLSMIIVSLLGSLGLSSAGALLSALALSTRMREVLLPILLFPILVPLLIGLVEATGEILSGHSIGLSSQWVKLAIAFDVVIFVGSFMTFEALLEE